MGKFSNSIKEYFINEDMNPTLKELIIRSTYSHNIICVIFLTIVLLVFILSNTLFRFIDCLFERKVSKEENIKEIEKKNVEIGLGIPFNFLVKNHSLKKLKYIQYTKKLQKGQITKQNYVTLNFQNNLKYEMEYLKYKCEILHGLDMSKINEDQFEEFVKNILLSSDKHEKAIILGDASYNLSVSFFYFF